TTASWMSPLLKSLPSAGSPMPMLRHPISLATIALWVILPIQLTNCATTAKQSWSLPRVPRSMMLVKCVTNRSEEHTSELQSRFDLVCRLLLEKKKQEKEMTDQTAMAAEEGT